MKSNRWIEREIKRERESVQSIYHVSYERYLWGEIRKRETQRSSINVNLR